VARISGKVQLVGDGSDKEMNSRRFYLTLPSNASMNLYPKNTAAQYTIKLPRTIALDGSDWEVALTELSVPAIFDNVLKNTCYVKMIDERTDTLEHPSEIYIVRSGYYHTVDNLVHEIRNMLVLLGVYLELDSDRVVLQNNGNYNVHLSRTLMEKLGFVDMPELGFGLGRHVAENQGDLTEKTVPTLFVYCDILEHVVVGDVMAPLLRMVDMKRKRTYGKMHETPHAPLYVPLQKKYFDTIEINIMTDTGDPVHFADGKSVAVLEFKRIGLLDKVI